MTLYETLFIVHPDSGGTLKEYIERFKKIIEDQGGTMAHLEEWGLRDLSYRIQKQVKGHYTLLQYHSTERAVQELERTMKLSDGVLRYLTVRLDDSAQAAPETGQTEISGGAKRSEEDIGKADPQT